MLTMIVAFACVNAGYTRDEAEVVHDRLITRYRGMAVDAVPLAVIYDAVTEIFGDLDAARRDDTVTM